MKLLLDACVWGGSCREIRDAGHDVVWAGDWQEDPGDEEILSLAHRERRILVTLDKDFGELAVLRGIRHSGILRLVGFGARQQAAVCLRVVESHGRELESGAIIVAEPGRLRVRISEQEGGG
jgi:predicted nuclease of predicted toxin-antitoxin system